MRGDDRGVVEAELLRSQEKRGAEALDLERPAELTAERVGEALRSDEREGGDDEGEHGDERAAAATASRLP